MRRLLLAAALLAPALPAAGAAVSWTGGGDATNWGDPANWAPAGVPTASDDVVLIASGGFVTAGAATAVRAQSLDLGSGSSSTTLRLSTGASVSGLFRVRAGATLSFYSTQPVSAAAFRVETGGLVDVFGPVAQATTAVTISALLFDLQSGATVNVTGKGFAGGEAITAGSGPGAGGSGTGGAGAGGAGHGATGGNGGLALNGGAAYGSFTAPSSAGSGGGGGLAPCVGGAGGGLVTVTAVTATVSGLVSADGGGGVSNCSQAGGGGSGGAVNLTAYNLTGSGQVQARGGAGGNGLAGRGGGGGAGGRVALKTTGLNLSALTVTVTGGSGGGGAPTGTGGGAGTAFIDPKVWTGAGTADCKDAANWVASVAPLAGDNVVFGSTASAKSCTWDFGLLPAGTLTLESGYAGALFWNTNLSSVTGRFLIQGGTLTVGAVDLRLGGDVQQTGGLINVTGGTVTLAGVGKAVTVSSAALFNHLVLDTGASVTVSSLTVGGNFTVKAGATMSVQSGAVLRLRGHATQLGSVAPAGGTFLFEGTTVQQARWSDFGSLTSSNPFGVSLLAGPASTTAVLGQLTIEPGGALSLASGSLAVGGRWVSSGSFAAGGGTVAFVGPALQDIVCGATQFAYVQMASTGGVVWSTAVAASLGVTFSSGTTDLGLSTHSVRGFWTVAGGAFRGSSGTVVFDGSSRQPVQGGAGSAFGRFVSSNPAGVALTADALVEADLELRRGALDLTARTLRVQGALRRQGGTAASAASSSTVVLDGRGLQDLAMAGGALDALVVANSSAGVRLVDALVVRGTFTVLPGAVFDGLSSSVTVSGASSAWATAGADYRSAGAGAHKVLWAAPAAGSLTVADGSTVAARVDVTGPVRLAGTLHMTGPANLLAVGAGATLDARAATVSLRGTSELWLSTGSLYRHDAGSWLVYGGSGTDRGLLLSTGPFGHILFYPEDPAATLRFKSVFLDGGLTAATGTVRLQDPARLDLKGDLRNSGGALDFGAAAGSTVAFTGASLQAYAPGAADDLPYLEVAGSSSVAPAGSVAVRVRRGTTLLSGVLQGSSARFWLSGDWTGRGGLFAAEGSTASFVSAATQAYADSSHQAFNGLASGPGPRLWRSSFDAAVFTATHPATTLDFSTSGVHVFGLLTALSSATASPVTLRGASPGLAARFSVGRSTVSAAVLRDFDATAGSAVYADDGRSVDGGNTPGVEFRPFLLVLSPGESLAAGSGRAGAASAQTAGTTFTVTVAAVSDAFLPVAGASTTLSASSSDPYDTDPATAPLAAGQAAFSFSLRRAEPAGLSVLLSAGGFGAAGVYGSTVTVQPAAFHTLQPVLPGESSQPGTPLGRGGVTDFQIAGRPFTLTVRAVDRFGNLTASVTDVVAVSQVSGASATLPGSSALAAGSAAVSGLVVHTTGLFTLTLVDVSSSGFTPAVSSTFSVFSLSAGSPTVNFALPTGASVGTLSGNVGGGARDTVAVTEVALALKDLVTGLWFDWAGSFSQSSPVARNAAVTPFRGTDVSWALPFDDGLLTTGRDYFAVVRASNPASLSTLSNSTFTFDRAILNFAPTDGEGSAAAAPASTAACQAAAVSVTVTVGRSGIGRGGVLALRVPPGWTAPAALSASSPSAPGFVAIVSTSPAWSAASSTAAFEPPAVGSVTLGAGWVTLSVASAAPNTFLPGQTVTFQYTGFPPPGTLGRQVFDVRSRSSGSGTLVALATAPAVTLAAGPARAVEFSPAGLLALGPLQASPTMQVRVTDGCGNAVPAPSSTTVALDAGQASPAGFSPDATAAFFSGGPATTTVSVASGAFLSAPFTFRTSTSGVSGLVLRASATFSGSAVQALRQVLVRASTVTATSVSIDTGTLAPGATSAVLTPGAAGARAVVRFTVADAGVPWEVLVATEASFTAPLARAAGSGDPDAPQTATWDAVVCGAVCTYAPPGRYPVRVLAGGNASSALEVVVATSPFLAGTLGASGAGALVRAEGPGTGPGSAAQADAAGAYRVDGLRAGVLYALSASSAALVAGAPVVLSTAAYGVLASTAGGAPGPLAFVRPAAIRVSASVPALSPEELFGVVTARRADGSAAASGALHFPRRGASSDDGGVAVGRAASTWTVLAVPPGAYSLSLTLDRLGVSTVAYAASASSSAFTDVAASFPRRAAVSGTLALPTTGPAVVPVSVSASSAGAAAPTRFAAVTLPDSSAAPAATATFRLFGLDAGSWTIAARAPGFAAASTVVFVPGDDDVGDPVTGAGGPGLALAFGSVLRGTVTVSGDSRGLAGTGPDPTNLPAAGFSVLVEAYAPSSGRRETLPVLLATSAAQASSAFSLTGLDTGTWLVRAAVSGFEKSPGGPETVLVSTSGGSVQLSFGAPNARARLSVVLPRPAAPCSCAADFAGLAYLHEPPSGPFEAVASATASAALSGAYSASSAAFTTGPLSPGLHRWTFLERASGRRASAALTLAAGTTAAATLDLTGATWTVTGTVLLAGAVRLSTGAAQVSASSMAAVVGLSARSPYCLLSSTGPVQLPAARVELVPMAAGLPPSPGALPAAGASCAAWAAPSTAPVFARAAAVAADGSFALTGVPPGVYRLRVPGDLDGRPGDEAAPVDEEVTVDADAALTVTVTPGAAVTGAARLPPGATGRRSLEAVLTDREGRTARSIPFEAAAGSSAAFTVPSVADGEYTLSVRDTGTPRSYAVRPRTVRVSGGAADAGTFYLEPAGAVRGRLAAERSLPGGAKELVLLTGADRTLLPASLRIAAVASPWTEGGFVPASGQDCDALGCRRPDFDAEGRFTVPGLVPGVYDVELIPSGGSAGADLAPAAVSGVRVEAGETVDLGVVSLRVAAALSGTLTDAAGGPAPSGVPVEARQSVPGSAGSRRPRPRAVSDAAGRFVLGGLDPAAPFYDVVAAPRSEDGSEPPAPWEQALVSGVDVRSTASVSLALRAASYAVSGTAAAEDGSALRAPADGAFPVPGARVWLLKAGSSLPGAGPLGELSLVTAPDGSFSIPGVGPGSYRLTAAAEGCSPKTVSVTVTTAAVSVGTLTLSRAAMLSGSLRRPDGGAPGEDEVRRVYAATPDSSELVPGSLVRDPAGRAVTGYRVGGFTPGRTYRLMLVSSDDEAATPPEAAALVFSSTAEARALDLVFRTPRPRVTARSRRSGSAYLVEFQSSQALRARTTADDAPASLLSTVTARGALSSAALSADRRRLTAVYTPAVGESSFTLRFSARGAAKDPDAADASEFLIASTVSFYAGLDGYHETRVPNLTGGSLSVDGDPGRLLLPKGAFLTDASSTVAVALRRSDELLTGARSLAAAGLAPAEAATRALRMSPEAYPADLLRALAATPPDVRPAGPYYDVALATTTPTRLARPARLTLAASAGNDPARLNVYWYNEAANAFVLQQDASGGALEVDAANRTVSLAVDHFSTYVLFDAAAAVISGNAFTGGDLTAYNFPNPFDLVPKTVTPIHGAPIGQVRGTMIRLSVPAGTDGDARIMVFSVAGERVKTLSLGSLSGGRTYYQPWDGTNDAGADVASGVYIGQAKVGGRSVFFKMAVIK